MRPWKNYFDSFHGRILQGKPRGVLLGVRRRIGDKEAGTLVRRFLSFRSLRFQVAIRGHNVNYITSSGYRAACGEE